MVENLQRENLNAIEEANGYRRLMDTYGLTQEEVAQKVGKSRSGIANSLRFLMMPKKKNLSKILERMHSPGLKLMSSVN